MIEITPTISLDDNELSIESIRATGPGGQNVNKVETAIQLRFDVANSPSLPPDVRARLRKLAGQRLTEDGILIITAKRYRTQLQNREDAQTQLVELIRKATEKPKPRHKTKPTFASKQRRLEGKRQHSATKQQRRSASYGDE